MPYSAGRRTDGAVVLKCRDARGRPRCPPAWATDDRSTGPRDRDGEVTPDRAYGLQEVQTGTKNTSPPNTLAKSVRPMSNDATEKQTDRIPGEREMLQDMETLERALPFKEYAKETEKLTRLVQRLEQEYDKREKIIDRIMEYGTGIESEKALRMYSIPVLEEWEEALVSFRAEELRKRPGSETESGEVTALRESIAKLRREQASLRAEDKAKLQSRIDELRRKLHARLAKTRRGADKREAKAKAEVHSLKSKAAAKRAEEGKSVKARIAKIKKPKAHKKSGSGSA